jgi:hypothetical protein
MLDLVTSLHFEALVIPATEISNLDTWRFRGRDTDNTPWLDTASIECFENGSCSALLLGRFAKGYCFILVVQWKTEVTAERISGFPVYPADDDKHLPPMEEGLEWREVRLV